MERREEMRKPYRFFLVLVSLLLLAIFAESCIYITGQNQVLPKNRSAFVILVPAIMICLFFLYKISKYIMYKMSPKALHILKYAILALIVLIQCLAIIAAIRGGFKGQTDSIKCINEAIGMLSDQGGKIDNSYGYFARYSNNNFFTILLFYLFKFLNGIGIKCYTEVLFVINTVMIDLAGVFTIKLVKNERAKVILLLLCALCPTTYVWILYIYTNTFSMPFIMGLLYFGVKGLREEKQSIFNITLGGTIGFLIRPTTIIPMIALVISITMFVKKWKIRILSIGVLAAVFCVLTVTASFGMKGNLVEPDNSRAFPFTHWVMMGVNEKQNGFVNLPDIKYSNSFSTKTEKMTGEWSKIQKRVKKMGVGGYAKLLMKKTAIVWGIGTDDFQMYNVCGEDVPDFYQYICGDKKSILMIWCQVIRGVTILMAFIECIFLLLRRRKKERFVYALTILGAILFLMLWETNKKYSICFMPLLLLLDCYGLMSTVQYGRIVKKKMSEKVAKNAQIAMGTIVIALSALLIVLGVVDCYQLKNEKKANRRTNIRIEAHSMDYEKLAAKGETIIQSFVTDRDFNEIQVTIKKSNLVEKGSYEFELTDEKGQVICRQSFPTKQKIVDRRMIFQIPTVRVDGANQTYWIRLICKKNQKQGIAIGHNPLTYYDVYSKGEMRKNDTIKLTDMRFMVSLTE